MHKNTGQDKGLPDSPDPRPPTPDLRPPTAYRHWEEPSADNCSAIVSYAKFEIRNSKCEIRNAKFDYTLFQSGRRNEDSLGSALPADALDIFTYFPIHSIHHPPCLRLDSSLPFVERIDPHPSVQLI